MDLQKLIYLEAIYRLGGFTKAAEEQHVSQPAITKAVKQLENTLGVTLVERSPKGICFSPAGLRLVEWARKIMGDFEAAEREMSLYSLNSSMSMKIGISNRVGSWLLREVYPQFIKQYPQCSIVMKEYSWDELCRMVAEGELDMAYTSWEKDFVEPELIFHPLLSGELFLVLPPKHELTRKKKISFKCLEGYKLSVYSENSLISKIITRRCVQEGVSAQLLSLSDHVATMLEMVDDGTALGFIVMDQKAAPLNTRKYVLRPLDESVLLNTGLITGKNRPNTRIMKLFSDFMKKQLQ